VKPLSRIGRFLQIDENGWLVNDCQSVIPDPWKSIVDVFRQQTEQFLGHHMHSLYVRGSIARGLAISGVSDLDAFAVFKGKIDKSVRKEWLLETATKIKSAFPFCVGIDLDFLDHDLLINSSRGADFRFLIKTQSTCIAGDDLRPALESFAPDLTVAFGCRCLKKDSSDFHNIFLEEVDYSEREIRCEWMMRKLLRAAGEIAMLKHGRYSRDLYLCWESFSEIYPFLSDEMRKVLYFAVNPSTDLAPVANLVHRVTEILLIEFDIASSGVLILTHEK